MRSLTCSANSNTEEGTATTRAVTEQEEIPTTKAATAIISLPETHIHNNNRQTRTLSSPRNPPDMGPDRSRAATGKRKMRDTVRPLV